MIKQRLANRSVILRKSYPDSDFAKYNASSQYIEMSTWSTVTKFMRYFGHLVSKLEVFGDFSLPHQNVKQVHQLINLYCSEMLTSLTITNQSDDVFADFTKPFPKVESVILNDVKRIQIVSFKFSEIFPSVRFLTLNSFDSFILKDQKLPYLEYLAIENRGDRSTFFIKNIVKNNPTIRRLAITCVGPELLEFVAESLPNIEWLQLCSYSGNGRGDQSFYFYFENLKTLIVKNRISALPSNVMFRDLEEIEMDPSPFKDIEMIKQILNCKDNLKKIQLNFVNMTNIHALAFATAGFNQLTLSKVWQVILETS